MEHGGCTKRSSWSSWSLPLRFLSDQEGGANRNSRLSEALNARLATITASIVSSADSAGARNMTEVLTASAELRGVSRREPYPRPTELSESSCVDCVLHYMRSRCTPSTYAPPTTAHDDADRRTRARGSASGGAKREIDGRPPSLPHPPAQRAVGNA